MAKSVSYFYHSNAPCSLRRYSLFLGFCCFERNTIVDCNVDLHQKRIVKNLAVLPG